MQTQSKEKTIVRTKLKLKRGQTSRLLHRDELVGTSRMRPPVLVLQEAQEEKTTCRRQGSESVNTNEASQRSEEDIRPKYYGRKEGKREMKERSFNVHW